MNSITNLNETICCWSNCLELIARRHRGSGVFCGQLQTVTEDIFIFAVLVCSDAKQILTASPLDNWRRPPGRPRTTWMKTSQLPRSVRTTLAQLRSGHCWLLNSYKARITSGISDVCPECGVAPHCVEHLFNCQSHPTQITVQDLWDNPVVVADFLNLDNWR